MVAGDVIYNGVHMYLAQSATVGFGPWRDAIGKVEALGPRHIVSGHKNQELDDDAKRTIEQTRQYLDDAEELLRTENTAVGYFNAKIERYPDYLGRLILWVTARALYGVREHPGEDPRQDHSRVLAVTHAAAARLRLCPRLPVRKSGRCAPRWTISGRAARGPRSRAGCGHARMRRLPSVTRTSYTLSGRAPDR